VSVNSLPISIVTVCRNAESTITRTIESVLGQCYPALQYIIIDGASVDSTLDIVSSFGEQIGVFVSEPDAGIADAFNKGIAQATGEIIGLVNADDTLLPGALEVVSAYFTANPHVEVVHGDVLLSDKGRVIKRVKPAGSWWYPWRLVLFNHPATFVRRSLYDRLGSFDLSYRIAMDVEIFLRWKSHGIAIAYLPEALVNMEQGGLSGQCALEGVRESRAALLKYGYSVLPTQLQYFSRILINKILCLR